MNKSHFRGIRRFFLAVFGIIGGMIWGCIALLFLLHLRMIFRFELPSIFLVLAIVIPVSAMVGLLMPRFFSMFFLSPISWLLFPENSGDCHPSGSNESSVPEFLYNACYMVGIVLFGFGVFFTIPALAIGGMAGILVFAFGVGKHLNDKTKAQR